MTGTTQRVGGSAASTSLPLPRRAHPPRRRWWLPVGPGSWRPQFSTLLCLLVLLQFVIPSRMVISGLGAVGRPAVLVGVLLLLLWFLGFLRPPGLPSHPQPVRWILGAYMAVQYIGYAVGVDRALPEVEANAADRWMILNLAMVGAALAASDGLRTRKDLDRLLKVLVGAAAVMALVGTLQFFGVIDLTRYIRIPGLSLNANLISVGERGSGGGVPRVAGTANHYIEFGVVLALVLPVALHYALHAPPGWRRRVYPWSAVALIAGSVPFAISRSGTLTLLVSVGILAVVWPWRMRYNALAVAAVSLIAFRAVNPGVLGTIRALFASAEHDPSVQNRLSDIGYVMELWAMRPWWGRGAGTYVTTIGSYTSEPYLLLDNQLFMTLVTGGVVGLVALVLLFAGPYLMARSVRLRGSDQETRHLGQALAAIMPAALLATATFDSFSFATFVTVVFVTVGAIGALWRLEAMSPARPLQAAAPGDTLVATPPGAGWGARAFEGATAMIAARWARVQSRGSGRK